MQLANRLNYVLLLCHLSVCFANGHRSLILLCSKYGIFVSCFTVTLITCLLLFRLGAVGSPCLSRSTTRHISLEQQTVINPTDKTLLTRWQTRRMIELYVVTATNFFPTWLKLQGKNYKRFVLRTLEKGKNGCQTRVVGKPLSVSCCSQLPLRPETPPPSGQGAKGDQDQQCVVQDSLLSSPTCED